MTLYYSASAAGFYDDAIHVAIPADARVISREDHQALLAAQAAGQRIIADETGGPIATDQAPRTTDQEMTRLRSHRDRLLRLSDPTQLADFPITEEERAAWTVWRAAMRDLPEAYAGDPVAVIWPDPPTDGVIS